MRILARNALTIGATVAFLAACGGSQSLIVAPGTIPQSRVVDTHGQRGGSWMLPEAKSQDLVYVSDRSSLLVYTTRGKQVGAIEYLSDPGVCSDAQGNVWITNGGIALEFPHGGTVPINEVYTPDYYAAVSCAVDSTTGSLALTLYASGKAPEIAVYQTTSETPQLYGDTDFSYFTYPAYDTAGNLYVNGGRGRKVLLGELPTGAGAITTITLNKKLGAVGGLQWDGKYLAVGDGRYNVVYQVSVSGSTATVQTSTHFFGWRFNQPVQFWLNNGIIGFVYSNTYYGLFRFPLGRRPAHRFIFQSSTDGGNALSVASTRSAKRKHLATLGNAAIVSRAARISPVHLGSSKSDLLYVGGGATTYVYSYPSGTPMGSLAQPTSGSFCSDKNGNVFLTYRDAVIEYAHGGTQPLRELTIPGSTTTDCSVDPTSGDLALTYDCPWCKTNLAIFPNGSGTPTRYAAPDAYTCGYDIQGNLFLAGGSGSQIAELVAGSSTFQIINIEKNIGNPLQVQWDGQYVALERENFPGAIYRLKISGSGASVVGTTKFRETLVWTNPSWIAGGAVVFPFSTHRDQSPDEIGIWQYPHGGKATATIKDLGGGVTVSVVPSH